MSRSIGSRRAKPSCSGWVAEVRAREQLEGGAFESIEAPVRPARPGVIELATALLIVGGVVGVVGYFTSSGSEVGGLDTLSILTLGLNLAQIAVGLMLRVGRLWLLAVNYVAVLAFLDLLASGVSPLALMLALAEIVVIVILFAQRPWFDAMRAWRADQPLTPPTARPPTR